MGRILVVDDHDSLRKGLVRALANAGHDVEEAGNGTAAIERLQDSQFDVVLTDLRMGGADGMDVLRTTRSIQPSAAVILMTAFGSIHTAVEAMKIGAFDFVQKPFEIEEMELKIEKAIELRHLKYQVDYLRHEQQDLYDFDRIVGASGALQQVLGIVKKVARSNSTVLIRGETGTGKELIAGAIHHNSNRSARAFVKVNCAALQENLLESELFGHEKGAYTSADKQRIGRFEQADGGTLFLDEVGDMSPSTQAKILRVLQEHEFERLGGTRTLRVDVRIIAATNRNLSQMVQEGRFREDLFYRLNVVSVDMPPLRDRKDDIPALAEFFVRRFANELKKKVDGIHPDAQKVLMRHNWPGNIRELENVIERAVLLAEKPMVGVDDLQIGEHSAPSAGSDRAPVVKIPPTGIPLEEIERQAVVEALRMSNWVQKDAAELLGISPRVMNYKIKILSIEIPAKPPGGHGDRVLELTHHSQARLRSASKSRRPLPVESEETERCDFARRKPHCAKKARFQEQPQQDVEPNQLFGITFSAGASFSRSHRISRKWWRRRESNPRPKGLSLQNSTCVAVLDDFARGNKERRMRRALVRVSLVPPCRTRVSTSLLNGVRSHPAGWMGRTSRT